MPIKIDWSSHGALVHKIVAVRELSETFAQNKNALSSITAALATSAVMQANDVLQILSTCGSRVTFRDDIIWLEGDGDITDLVSKCRNAACHSASKLRDLEENTILGTIWGKMPNAYNIKGKIVGCEYTDDIALVWGGLRLLLRRNLLRAMAEAEAVLQAAEITYPTPQGG